jgi:hypothetical protein
MLEEEPDRRAEQTINFSQGTRSKSSMLTNLFQDFFVLTFSERVKANRKATGSRKNFSFDQSFLFFFTIKTPSLPLGLMRWV